MPWINGVFSGTDEEWAADPMPPVILTMPRAWRKPRLSLQQIIELRRAGG